MLNPVTFMVEGESGPLAVTCNGSDYAAYEDAFDRVAINDIFSGRYKCWVYLLWHAQTRQGTTTLTFDEFLDSTPHFEPPTKAEDIVPLGSPALTGE